MASVFVLFNFPASSNYQLKSYEFGGGGGVSDSTNYSVEGIHGQQEGRTVGTNYGVGEGLLFTQLANVPAAPTLANSSNWYNKLLLTLQTSNNPTDAEYAIAISTDNFTTTNYVQSDNTVGATLGSEDWQTYASWGGGSGEYIIGLSPNTTYYVKVKARQGDFTESQWGPSTSTATSQLSLTFDIDVASTDTESAAPYVLAMGQLTVGAVTTASEKIWLDLETNAANGGYVYIYDENGGLRSSAVNYTITSATADLTGAAEGFGVRSNSVAQSAGGPLVATSPYNGASDNVGVLNSTIQEVFHSSGAPITAGRASLLVKAKISAVTPASSDYADILTLITSATF